MHGGHRLTQNRHINLRILLIQGLTRHQIHHRKNTPQNRLVSTNAMNHWSFQALLIQDPMHNLKVQKLLNVTFRTQNAKNPWLLINQLVAIQPGIETSE